MPLPDDETSEMDTTVVPAAQPIPKVVHYYDSSRIIVDSTIFVAKFIYVNKGITDRTDFKNFFDNNCKTSSVENMAASADAFCSVILSSGDSVNNPIDSKGVEKRGFTGLTSARTDNTTIPLVYAPNIRPTFTNLVSRLYGLIRKVKDWSTLPLYCLHPNDYNIINALSRVNVVLDRAQAKAEHLDAQLTSLSTTLNNVQAELKQLGRSRVSFAEQNSTQTLINLDDIIESSSRLEEPNSVEILQRTAALKHPQPTSGISTSWSKSINASVSEWGQQNQGTEGISQSRKRRLVAPEERDQQKNDGWTEKKSRSKSKRGTAPALDPSGKFSMRTKKAIKIKFCGELEVSTLRAYIVNHDKMKDFAKNGLIIEEIYSNEKNQMHKVLFEDWPLDRNLMDESLWPPELEIAPWKGKVDAPPNPQTAKKWHLGGPGINPTTTAESLSEHIKGVYRGGGTHTAGTDDTDFVVDVVEFNEGAKAKSRLAKGETKICNFVIRIAYRDARTDDIPDYITTFYGSKSGHFAKSWTGKFPGKIESKRNPFTQETY
jgi:hypothetical protein